MNDRRLLRHAAMTLVGSLLAGSSSGSQPGQELLVPSYYDLVVETLSVGPGGTETLSSDIAGILLGQGAFLEKEVTLSGRMRKGRRATEKIRFRAEIGAELASPSRLNLRIKSRVDILATTGGIPIPRSEIARSGDAELRTGASQLFEIYESSSLGTKLALNIRWFVPEGDATEDEIERTPIPLAARLFEVGDVGPVLVSDNQLLASLGGSAVVTFSRSVPLPPGRDGGKRFRQEKLEVTLSPRFRAGQSLCVALEAVGEVVTRTVDEDFSHPLARQGIYILSAGLPATVEMEVVADESGNEGWTRLRYRLEVIARF